MSQQCLTRGLEVQPSCPLANVAAALHIAACSNPYYKPEPVWGRLWITRVGQHVQGLGLALCGEALGTRVFQRSPTFKHVAALHGALGIVANSYQLPVSWLSVNPSCPSFGIRVWQVVPPDCSASLRKGQQLYQ